MIRVTEVLDYFAEPYLVKWKLGNKEWEKISNDAKELGSMIDSAVQRDINEANIESIDALLFTNDHRYNCWKAWTQFKADRPDIFEAMRLSRDRMQMELKLFDIVGHPDFVLDDEVIDLKTSKHIYKSNWMQIAQYAFMASLSRGYDIKKISVLRLDKESGHYEFKSLKEPFISFWQKKFQCRYEAFKEDAEFAEMMRVKLEEEKLG